MEKLRELAALGNADALYRLGNLYLEGVPQDHEEAAKNFLQAAELGLADAQDAVGTMHYVGDGVPEDYDEAFAWYDKAAEQGNVQALVHVGDMHLCGDGTPEDVSQAIICYRKAAERGNPEAQWHLGCLYADGDNVPQDVVEAYKWFALAVEASSGTDGQDYYRRSRDELGALMSPVQIKVAQKLADAMRQKIDEMKRTSSKA
jgi:hypothetical protein